MKAVGVLLLLVLIAGGAVGVVLYRRAEEPYKAYQTTEQFVEIAPGSSTRAIGDALIGAGVVRDGATFRVALWRTGSARMLKAGTYRFDESMTAVDVVRKIAKGDTWVQRITFPEGLNMMEMARIFEQQKFGPTAAFLEAARNVEPVASIDPAAKDLEGYLFPETYSLPPKTTATKLVQLMTARFEQLFTAEMRAAAGTLGLSVRQAVTLASIVEKETAQASERPIVAAVYLNRLKIGMPLQCDPTVIYAMERSGHYSGNIRRADLEIDSPYNTYRYPGLPPGPIASPGLASLKAAVDPAPVDYLYFVSRNDGTHVFARTLEEHNANVHKFQVEYFRTQKR